MKKFSAAAALILAVNLLLGVFTGSEYVTSADEPCELVIETVTFGGENKGNALVEEAVNAIIEPAIGAKIRLLDIGIAQHEQKIGQMIAGGDQIDLVMAGLTYPMVSMVADGLLMRLDELVLSTGVELQNIFGDQLKAGYVGDTLYAVPADINTALASGIMYNGETAQAAGLDIPEICSFEDLDRIFDAVTDNNPGFYAISYLATVMPISEFFYSVENYGSTFLSFGVTLNPWENMEIVNMYQTSQYRQLCLECRKWQEKGYLPHDIMTSSITPIERMTQGQTFCWLVNYSPLSAVQISQGKYEVAKITAAKRTTGSVQERMWGIPVTSRYPEKAMEFLQLLYTDTRLANLLSHGIEGRDFIRLGDHEIEYTDKNEYKSIFTYFGNQLDIDMAVPAGAELIALQKEFEENAYVSLTLGYSFDSQSVAGEVAAVNEVIGKYAPPLECGLVEDVDGALKVFNEELEKAGIEVIIEENRRQLEQWLAR